MAELPVTMQLFSVLPRAPPPSTAELPLNVQLFSVPPYAPPPSEAETPLVKVNPDKLAPWAMPTQRLEWPPSITVNSGPLTLRTFRRLWNRVTGTPNTSIGG